VSLRPDLGGLAFASSLIAASLLVIAGVAALTVRRLDLTTTMKTRGLLPRERGLTGRNVFVVGQIAIALVLVFSGWLLVASLRLVQSVELGFEPDGVIAATVSLPATRYRTAAERVAFYDALLRESAASLPTATIAVGSRVPFTSSATAGVYTTVVPTTRADAATSPHAPIAVVSPSYFDVLGARVSAGRSFSNADRADGQPVAIVDEALARQLYPTRSAVGGVVRLQDDRQDTMPRIIVGIVPAMRGLDPATPPEPMIYLPYAQVGWPTMSVVARPRDRSSRLEPRDLSRLIHAVDPTRPVYNALHLRAGVDRRLSVRRLQTGLMFVFAATALMLALLGIYGVSAFGVRQRQREIGIRLAVGAAPRQILLAVLKESAQRIVWGSAAGVVMAVIGGRVMASLLFDISPWNPWVLTAALALTLVAGLLSSLGPALTASRADPLATLRSD